MVCAIATSPLRIGGRLLQSPSKANLPEGLQINILILQPPTDPGQKEHYLSENIG